MIRPIRLQRMRVRGFNLQQISRAANGLAAVYVGRPSKFGNPFRVSDEMTAERAVALYRAGIEGSIDAWSGGPKSIFRDENDAVWQAWEQHAPHLQMTEIELSLAHLAGKNLACWCPLDAPCHADVLIEIANHVDTVKRHRNPYTGRWSKRP